MIPRRKASKNIVGKEENAGVLSVFSIFPKICSKISSPELTYNLSFAKAINLDKF